MEGFIKIFFEKKQNKKLPEGINYKEYDINPYARGRNRGAE